MLLPENPHQFHEILTIFYRSELFGCELELLDRRSKGPRRASLLTLIVGLLSTSLSLILRVETYKSIWLWFTLGSILFMVLFATGFTVIYVRVCYHFCFENNVDIFWL